jgi:hypothetical protein
MAAATFFIARTLPLQATECHERTGTMPAWRDRAGNVSIRKRMHKRASDRATLTMVTDQATQPKSKNQ